MFEVECPSCKAGYQVDERRVPPNGLKMRCPKCGESFPVHAPGVGGDELVLGAALGLAGEAGRSTMIGVAPQKAAPPAAPARAPNAKLGKSTMIGVAPAADAPAPPAGPPRPASPRPAGGAPRPPRTRGADASPPRPSGGEAAPPRPSAGKAPPTVSGAKRPPPPRREATGLELDLPSPVKPPAADVDLDEIDLEADLPAASGGRGFSLARSSEADDDEPDLPSPVDDSAEELELPLVSSASYFAPPTAKPKRRVSTEPPQEIDLPSIPPSPGAAAGADQVDLPAPIEDDLPAPAVPDLPSVTAELPDLTSDLPEAASDLPDLSADLPAPTADLPNPASILPIVGAGLPERGGDLPEPLAGFPDREVAFPPARDSFPPESQDLEAKGFGFSSAPPGGDEVFSGRPLDLTGAPPPPTSEDSLEASLGGAAASGAPPAFGEVDLTGGSPSVGFTGRETEAEIPSDDDEFDGFPTDEAAAKARSGDTAGGGEGYGEVALDSGVESSEVSLDDDAPRYAPAPTGSVSGAAAAAHAPVSRGAQDVEVAVLPKEKKHFSNTAKVGAAAAVILAVGGGALSLLPDVGPYGSYIVIDTLKAEEYQSTAEEVRSEAAELWASDVAAKADQAFLRADAAHRASPRYAPLKAYVAYLAFARQIRFGPDPRSLARGKVLLDAMEELGPDQVAHLRLARVARDAAEGKYQGAVSRAQQMLRSEKGKLDVVTLAGEIALATGDAKLALEAWSQAGKLQDSARTMFGLARAQSLAGDTEAAAKSADAALAKSPDHVGAQLLLAEIGMGDVKQDAKLVAGLEKIAAPGSAASAGERTKALVLLGGLHMARSRLASAEKAYTDALALESNSLGALRGLGDALFAGGRFAEALARYEAAAKVDPQDLGARLGVVRAKLSLQELEDAGKLLEALKTEYPKSTAVSYWFGAAREAVGERDKASEAYQKAVDLGEDVPELVQAYVGSTRLLAKQGKGKEALKTITAAVDRFPKRPEVYLALGDLAVAQGGYERAIAHYDKAMGLDPANVGTHFRRGVALRKARRFDEAHEEFDRVAKEQKEYPGLALERGLAFQEAGRAEEALAEYEAALKAAPDDLDIMLRVGCGKASQGQTKEALVLLDKVLDGRAGSPEANHCKGRALLMGDGDINEAQRFLQRAASLDQTRAEYFLYVGWAANQKNDFAQAEKSLSQALELDRGLADAYWQRGVLRVRQSAVIDAIADLEKALELKPSRHEAYAALAEAYTGLGKEQQAMQNWEKAVTSGPTEPGWHYQYGRLLLNNRARPAARQQLEKAVEQGENLEPKPAWIWDAHRLMAMAIGRDRSAIPHWAAFVKNAPNNSPYLEEAVRELAALGVRVR